MSGVVCIGACHVDVKASAAEKLRRGTSNPVVTRRTPGGVACNVARWLARLGTPVRLVSLIGDDALGATLVERLADEGVDVRGVDVLAGEATATYTAVLESDGSLAFGLADMAIYDRMDHAWAISVAGAIRDADLVVVDANPTAAALEYLAASLPRVFADPVSVDKSLRLLAAVPMLEAIFPDSAEAEALTGHGDPSQAASALVGRGAGIAVVTAGAEGVVIADRNGVRLVPARPVERIVDVTGAGDAFLAGFVHATVNADTQPERWGLAAAALAVATSETVPDSIDIRRLRDW